MDEGFTGWDGEGGKRCFGALYLSTGGVKASSSESWSKMGMLAEMEVVGTTRHACGTPVAGVGRVGP